MKGVTPVKSCAFVIVAACLSAPSLGQQLVQLTPDASGLPAGFAYHTFDLQWSGLGDGVQWTSSSVQFVLADRSLSFYQAQGGDAIAQLMPPKPSEVAGDPALAWDTFVTTPFGFPNISDDALLKPPLFAPPVTSEAQLIDAIWFVAGNEAQALPYSVARFTIRGPVGLELTLQNTGIPVGTIDGLTTTNITGLFFYGAIIYAVPEPAGWIGLIGLALVLRRR
jgi:hypothetical protein